MSPQSPRPGGSPAMGPYGHGSAQRPGTGAGGAARPGAGTPPSSAAARPGAGTLPGNPTARPGTGAAPPASPPSAGNSSTTLPAGGAATRPGIAAGGAGVLPGAGAGTAGRPGVGAGGLGGPYSGVGVLPGAGAGATGIPGAGYAAGRYGTYYNNDAALVAQRDATLAVAHTYPPYYNAAAAGAWRAASYMTPSLYANPGYGAVAGMMGMSPQPAPYDYGGNVVAQPNAVYVNGDPAGTPQQYADQAGQIATAGASQPDPDGQWLPLGVFAMVEPDQTQPTDLFQLAVNKQGQIRGNYHNVQSNETTPLAGAVDHQSQRSAWTIGGDQTPIYEAGIVNLTKDQTTMLVHTADGQQRQFTLIRLPEPSSESAGASAQP